MRRIPTAPAAMSALIALAFCASPLGGCLDRPEVEDVASDAASDVPADHGVLFAPSWRISPAFGPEFARAPASEVLEAEPAEPAPPLPVPPAGILPARLLADVSAIGVDEDDRAEPDSDAILDPSLLERAGACSRPERDDDMDCDLPVAPSTLAYHPDTHRVAMLWSPVIGGGADCSDVFGLILRASDGKSVATRTLVDTEACEEELEYETEGLAVWRWLAFLHKRGYVDVDDAVVDTIGPWGEDEGSVAVLSGALSGWGVFVEPSADEVRVLLVAPGNQVAFELDRQPIEEESCWEPGEMADELDEEDAAKEATELEDMDCSLRYPHIEDVVLSPDERHLIVAYGMTGASCHSDSEYSRIIAPLPGAVVGR